MYRWSLVNKVGEILFVLWETERCRVECSSYFLRSSSRASPRPRLPPWAVASQLCDTSSPSPRLRLHEATECQVLSLHRRFNATWWIGVGYAESWLNGTIYSDRQPGYGVDDDPKMMARLRWRC
jgi:hypothetical protein